MFYVRLDLVLEPIKSEGLKMDGLSWDIHQHQYLWIVILTFIPALELRASIPYGIIVAKLPWFVVFPIAIIANIALGPVIYFLLDQFLHLVLRLGPVRRFWDHMIIRTQKKIAPLVKTYGIIGLSIFIGIPLPGSGVYSGAIGGYLLGFNRRQFYLCTVIGVLMAGIVVTVAVMSGSEAFKFFIKKV